MKESNRIRHRGGKNKIRPNKEELSEKPDKGKQNRGGGVIMED